MDNFTLNNKGSFDNEYFHVYFWRNSTKQVQIHKLLIERKQTTQQDKNKQKYTRW